LERRLAALRGRVVVVDVWATWCAPCLERFPRMVALDRRWRDRGVSFVSLSVDNREDRQAVDEARRFLVRVGAAFPNYLLDENVLRGLEMLDLSGIPAVLVYDREGRLRHKLTGDNPNRQFTDRDVEEAVKALL
jgi:thiol-disulfide isomerase/thioredoxin